MADWAYWVSFAEAAVVVNLVAAGRLELAASVD